MYNKLFGKIVTSSIWLERTPTRLLWVTFLAMMDQDGFVEMASVKNLAHTARLSEEEVSEALRILENPDPDSSDPENEGKRVERVPGGWLVLNAKKYSSLVTREVARERTRERVRKHRMKRNGELLLVTQSESESDANPKPKTKNPPLVPPAGGKRAIQMPEGFAPNESHQEMVKELNVDLGKEFPAFVDFHRSKGSTFKDWDAALRTWIRNAKKFARTAPAAKESNYDRFMRLNGGGKKVIEHG